MPSQSSAPKAPARVIYVAGPGDAISAHKSWKSGVHDPTEVAITFSGQIEQYCKEVGAALSIVCYHRRRETLKDGETIIEHLPKFWPEAGGLAFHARELVYGLMLLYRALRFRADTAILDSGCTHYFWQSLFALSGMRVVPVLHNALWPNGYRPRNPVARAIEFLDGFFWRHVPVASLCVSPLCARQVQVLAGPKVKPLVQIRAQFDGGYFASIPPTPPHSMRPFQIMFIGRIVEDKGVFDILDMAAGVEARSPGGVRWVICGTGADFDELKQRRDAMALESIVELRGWTSLADLQTVLACSHASIVPTRSTFIEGLAMTAVEAALAGRPVITNPVVPALELLSPAALHCRTNDTQSYIDAILKLIDDPQWHQRLVDACPAASAPFLDRRFGLTHVLTSVLGGAPSAGAGQTGAPATAGLS